MDGLMCLWNWICISIILHTRFWYSYIVHIVRTIQQHSCNFSQKTIPSFSLNVNAYTNPDFTPLGISLYASI